MQTTLDRTQHGKFSQAISPGVWRIPHGIVNSYMVADEESGAWILVDAGLKTSARHIRHAAEEQFGPAARPEAIILTHGHFDHVGALMTLAEHWDVPVYAHRLETPYLNGRAQYPPPDPTVGGGMMSVMSRFFTRGPINLGPRLRVLPDNGDVPGLLPNWRWIHTPGHSPGHISLWDERRRIVIAGDAFVTTQQESAMAVLTQKEQVNGPPAYFTPDWPAARESVRRLAALQPEIAATGHGHTMRGARLLNELRALAANFDQLAMPRRGRYVAEPAIMDEHGVVSVPPPVSDPMPKFLLAIGLVGAIALAWNWQRRRPHA